MSTYLGKLRLTPEGAAMLIDMECFDDAFVPVGLDRPIKRRLFRLGAMEATIAAIPAYRELKRGREIVRAKGRASAVALADALGVSVLPTAKIARAHLSKELIGPTRKLVFRLTDGTTRTYLFGKNAQSPAEVAQVMQPALRERFTSSLG